MTEVSHPKLNSPSAGALEQAHARAQNYLRMAQSLQMELANAQQALAAASEAQAQLAATRAELSALQVHVQAMTQSVSWRVTRPLRWFRTWVDQKRQGNQPVAQVVHDREAEPLAQPLSATDRAPEVERLYQRVQTVLARH